MQSYLQYEIYAVIRQSDRLGRSLNNIYQTQTQIIVRIIVAYLHDI
ncbi:MAG: hypothetical protein OXG24_02010 [Gammaproteobacteria bacterium]|nr:hypothetical protein [Gammaproteobacteria bacterium]